MPGMSDRLPGLAECEDCDWKRPTAGGSFAEAAATRGHSIVRRPGQETGR